MTGKDMQMSDREKQFAAETDCLAKVHHLAEQALEFGDAMDAATLLFAAALNCLNRVTDVHHAMGAARIWASSLEVQTIKREGTH